LPSPVPIANTAVVIPTYNERDNILKVIEALLDLYPAIHILVVDDHSRDGTAGIVRAMHSQRSNLMLLERTKNRGFASSYRDGFRRVCAEFCCRAVVTMDADFSHDPGDRADAVQIDGP
jgi:dolichol-phosphate mannosyltransferase